MGVVGGGISEKWGGFTQNGEGLYERCRTSGGLCPHGIEGVGRVYLKNGFFSPCVENSDGRAGHLTFTLPPWCRRVRSVIPTIWVFGYPPGGAGALSHHQVTIYIPMQPLQLCNHTLILKGLCGLH